MDKLKYKFTDQFIKDIGTQAAIPEDPSAIIRATGQEMKLFMEMLKYYTDYMWGNNRVWAPTKTDCDWDQDIYFYPINNYMLRDATQVPNAILFNDIIQPIKPIKRKLKQY